MNHTPEPVETPATGQAKRSRFRATVGAGLLAGLVAVAIGGVAAAQSGTTVLAQVDDPNITIVEGIDNSDGDADKGDIYVDDFDVELSAEDEAVFETFDQCLVDAGLDVKAFDELEELDDDKVEAAFEALDETVVDAAFESCEPILDGLSGEVFVEFIEDCDDDDEDGDEDDTDDEDHDTEDHDTEDHDTEDQDTEDQDTDEQED